MDTRYWAKAKDFTVLGWRSLTIHSGHSDSMNFLCCYLEYYEAYCPWMLACQKPEFQDDSLCYV